MLTGPNAVRKYCNIYYSEWWWNIQLRERRQRRQRRRQCWTAKTFNTLFRTARTFLPLGDIAWPHHQATSPSHGVHEIAYILIKHVRPEYNEVKHKNNRILVLCDVHPRISLSLIPNERLYNYAPTVRAVDVFRYKYIYFAHLPYLLLS